MLPTNRLEELEAKWETAQKRLQEVWPRKGHKLCLVIHEGNQMLDDEEATDIIGEVHKLEKRQPVDLILHTHGGTVPATLRVADALTGRAKTAAFVPFYSQSAGTLIALATQKIFLGKGASLGPLDMQSYGVRARDIVQTAEELGDNESEELRLAAKDAARALKEEVNRVCTRINPRHKGWFGLAGCTLAENLTLGESPHWEPIRYREAKRLGINVSKKLPDLLYGCVTRRRAQLRQLQRARFSEIRIVAAEAMKSAREQTIDRNLLCGKVLSMN